MHKNRRKKIKRNMKIINLKTEINNADNKISRNTDNNSAMNINYSELLRERSDYAYSLKKVNKFGDFLLEGRVIEIDFQKEKDIFRCKMSVDPMGIKWVDFFGAAYSPKLLEVFFIRSRNWNSTNLTWHSFIWSEFAQKETKKAFEKEQKELKKTMSPYYTEYGHSEFLDAENQAYEDYFESYATTETLVERNLSFRLKNRAATSFSIYDYKIITDKVNNPYGLFRDNRYFEGIDGHQSLVKSFLTKEFSINGRYLKIRRSRRYQFPYINQHGFYTVRRIFGFSRHQSFGPTVLRKAYKPVLLAPESSLLQSERIFLKNARRKQLTVNSTRRNSLVFSWLSWSLVFNLRRKLLTESATDKHWQLLFLIGARVSKARVYNKLRRTLFSGSTSLEYYDLLRTLTSTFIGNLFELFILGSVVNPEEDEFRSCLAIGHYPKYRARVRLLDPQNPAHQRIKRPLPIAYSFASFNKPSTNFIQFRHFSLNKRLVIWNRKNTYVFRRFNRWLAVQRRRFGPDFESRLSLAAINRIKRWFLELDARESRAELMRLTIKKLEPYYRANFSVLQEALPLFPNGLPYFDVIKETLENTKTRVETFEKLNFHCLPPITTNGEKLSVILSRPRFYVTEGVIDNMQSIRTQIRILMMQAKAEHSDIECRKVFLWMKNYHLVDGVRFLQPLWPTFYFPSIPTSKKRRSKAETRAVFDKMASLLKKRSQLFKKVKERKEVQPQPLMDFETFCDKMEGEFEKLTAQKWPVEFTMESTSLDGPSLDAFGSCGFVIRRVSDAEERKNKKGSTTGTSAGTNGTRKCNQQNNGRRWWHDRRFKKNKELNSCSNKNLKYFNPEKYHERNSCLLHDNKRGLLSKSELDRLGTLRNNNNTQIEKLSLSRTERRRKFFETRILGAKGAKPSSVNTSSKSCVSSDNLNKKSD